MIARFAACLLAIVATAALVPSGALAAEPGATAPKPRVSLSVPGQVGPARTLVAKGAIAPVPSRGRVRVEYRLAGKWRALGSSALRGSAFKVAGKLAAGVARTRVHAVLIEGGRPVATSPSHTVRVRGAKKTPAPVPPTPGPPAPEPVPPTPTPPAAACPPTTTSDPLSAGSLMESVRQYAALPNHLSSTPNSAAALDEFGCKLEAAGLTLGQQAFAYPEFVPRQVALTAGSTGVPEAAIAPLLYSGVTPAGGVTAELVDGTGGFTEAEAKGNIVVVPIEYEHNSKAIGLYQAIENAVVDKAAGLVAVTQVVGDYPKWEDVNARRASGHLPVVTVGKRSGVAVMKAAEEEKDGTLTLTASTGTACDRDVWGELEGAEPGRRVFVGTPASSFTPSASEHGTGVAITLGLARHYAALPVSQRPATLVFMALGGHEIGWLGLQALMASPEGDWFKGAEAYVHLGSALGAPNATEEDGKIITTPEPDPTGRLHDSENPLLTSSIIEDWEAAGVSTPETPPHTASGGEQTYAYAAGIPTVSFSGASLYFHTAGDLPSTVDPTILARDADAFRRSVDTITGLAPGALKKANGKAEEEGAKIDPDERAPVNPTLGAGVEGPLGKGGVGGPAATPVASCP